MIFKSLKSSPLFFGLSTVLALCLSPAAQAQAPLAKDFITVSGNASYLQRIAMPPEAVLTVQVQDVSRAGATATVLAESREVFDQRQVPLAYSVMVARSAINPRMRYAVHATISIAGKTQFATARRAQPGQPAAGGCARSEPAGKPTRTHSCIRICAISQVCPAGHVCRRAALR